MVAQQRGYFKAEGLNVTFQIAKGGVDVAKQVGAGNAVVGGGIGDTSIIVRPNGRSEEHTSELQSLMRISYAVFCLKKKNISTTKTMKNTTYITIRYHTRPK